MHLTRALLALSGKSAEKFVKYGAYSPTPLSLKKITSFGLDGSAEKSATFLREELPVRLANIMQEIHLLPEQLVRTPSASLVNRWYEQSFSELVEFDQVKWSDKLLEEFNKTLAKIRNRHSPTVETMAQGVMEMQERHDCDVITNNQVQYFLDRFYMMRISLRMLVNQHLLMYGPELNKQRRFVGSIDPDCNVLEILEDAYEDAQYLCKHYYSSAPSLEVEKYGASEGKIQFVYVPSHLYHILFELLKNAMRAVVETHSKADTLPPVKVLVSAGLENVTFKISDLGGGIPRSEMSLVFNYTYTTARGGDRLQHESADLSHEEGNAPLAGYGYGLPLSRLYARYFNGDLLLASVEGYGTDAIVYLKRNAAEADELLPVFNRTSARRYGSSSLPIGDWSSRKSTTRW
ncbi:unnamed protein product [Calicophoron daubneyi]|uniref:Protein-serine/threonine kinase n=1 Tax=Calicophoron daubneyi TaxID=300641 RepID=A0AAV2T3I1_CALDB